MYEDIKDKVEQIIVQYGTNDPVQIAERMGYRVIFTTEFPTLTAILINNQIIVNENLPDTFKRFAITHELGHIFYDSSHPPRDNPILNSLESKEDIQHIFSAFLLYQHIREHYNLDPIYYDIMIRHTMKKATDQIQKRVYLPDSDEEFDSSLADTLFILNFLQTNGSLFS